MTSSINPNNINGAYPVAGQDNNSQGFRDNFTNTKTNFQYAADEITELQNNCVLKAPLSGSTLNNDMLGSILSNAQIQDFAATLVALGTLSGPVNINYAAGHYQTITTNGSISLAFANWPAAGIAGFMSVSVNVSDVTHTLTLPSAVSVNNNGIQGLDPITNIITFATTGIYTFQFTTNDGGYVINISQLNTLLQPFNNTFENLASGAAVNLGTAISYFTTVAPSTATLAAGIAGQVKTFVTYGFGGNMVITVTNPGWSSSSSGTITFSSLGSTCVLQYIGNKWFCISNNGAVFG